MTLKGFLELSRNFGIDGFSILKEVRIGPLDLSNAERRLPASSVIQALESAAKLASCQNFGLLLGRARTFEDLGPMSLLMERLDTPRKVVEASIEHRRHFNDLLDVSISDFGEQASIKWDLFATNNAWQSIDLGIVLAYRLLSGSSRGQWRPTCVHLTHSSPDDLRPWKQTFPCAVEFNSSFNGFSCSPSSLDVRNPMANDVMAGHLLQLLDLVPLAERGGSMREQVQRTIGLLLPESRANLIEVSKLLELSPRTVQRSLELEGTGFSIILQDTRLDYARRYLRNPSRSVTAVAELLGYSSIACFSRWFQKMTGETPSKWRLEFVRAGKEVVRSARSQSVSAD